MKLLLDENYSPEIARQLRARGHDVVAVKEMAELVGLEDEIHLATSPDERRAIVTENVRDFRPLLHDALRHGRPNYGLICVSPRRFPRAKAQLGRLIMALDHLLATFPGDEDLCDREWWLQDPPA